MHVSHNCCCCFGFDAAGRGLEELREFLLERATPGEWTLDAGMATDQAEEEQVRAAGWGGLPPALACAQLVRAGCSVVQPSGQCAPLQDAPHLLLPLPLPLPLRHPVPPLAPAGNGGCA